MILEISWFCHMGGEEMGGWRKNRLDKIIAVDGWIGTSNDAHQPIDDSVKSILSVGTNALQ